METAKKIFGVILLVFGVLMLIGMIYNRIEPTSPDEVSPLYIDLILLIPFSFLPIFFGWKLIK